jgi:hypothetical protein
MVVGLGLVSILGAITAWIGWRRETRRIRRRRFSFYDEAPAGMTTEQYERRWLRFRRAMVATGWAAGGVLGGLLLSVVWHAAALAS